MVEKRRRKKARTQAESSSEDESSASDVNNDSPSELSELSDDEIAPQAQQPSTSSAPTDASEVEHPRERMHKAPHNSSAEFNQIYMKMITEQFGEDLASLREANDFGPASITQLVAGLKQGVDIFDEEQARMLRSDS